MKYLKYLGMPFVWLTAPFRYFFIGIAENTKIHEFEEIIGWGDLESGPQAHEHHWRACARLGFWLAIIQTYTIDVLGFNLTIACWGAWGFSMLVNLTSTGMLHSIRDQISAENQIRYGRDLEARRILEELGKLSGWKRWTAFTALLSAQSGERLSNVLLFLMAGASAITKLGSVWEWGHHLGLLVYGIFVWVGWTSYLLVGPGHRYRHDHKA